jgi:hypothetical protein
VHLFRQSRLDNRPDLRHEELQYFCFLFPLSAPLSSYYDVRRNMEVMAPDTIHVQWSVRLASLATFFLSYCGKIFFSH